MPEIRDYRRFGRNHFAKGAIGATLLIPVWVFLWHRADSDRFDPPFWIASAVFTTACLAGLIWNARRLRRITCLQCNAPIPRNPAKPGAPINYTCKRCDIEWVTGLSESD